MTPKDAILFKIVHTCAKECLILKYKYIQNPWFTGLFSNSSIYTKCVYQKSAKFFLRIGKTGCKTVQIFCVFPQEGKSLQGMFWKPLVMHVYNTDIQAPPPPGNIVISLMHSLLQWVKCFQYNSRCYECEIHQNIESVSGTAWRI